MFLYAVAVGIFVNFYAAGLLCCCACRIAGGFRGCLCCCLCCFPFLDLLVLVLVLFTDVSCCCCLFVVLDLKIGSSLFSLYCDWYFFSWVRLFHSTPRNNNFFIFVNELFIEQKKEQILTHRMPTYKKKPLKLKRCTTESSIRFLLFNW